MRANNFGALRLFLAAAVIWSHAPQLLDGNFSREPLVALGAAITLGTIAVDGFFIISGYLIASSWLKNPYVGQFFTARILRIYPAFIVASLICIFMVAPLAGGDHWSLNAYDWLKSGARLLFLRYPEVPGSFSELEIASLNGAMWTLRYEFNCYLLVLGLGLCGLFAKRAAILALTVALYCMAAFIAFSDCIATTGITYKVFYNVVGDPKQIVMLAAVFMSGACFRLYQDKIKFSAAIALPLIFPLAGALFFPLPDIAVGTIGAYVLLWLALSLKSRALESLNNRYDFSYGTYLYAWPICSLIVLALDGLYEISPIALTAVTTALALVAGAISWYAIEKPAIRLRTARGLTSLEAIEPASA